MHWDSYRALREPRSAELRGVAYTQTDPIGGYKLVVFDKMQTANTYVWKLVDHWDEKIYSGVVISKAPPGRYSQFENAKISVTTKLDGIYLEFIEKGAILYYWSDGRFKKLQVWG